MTVFPDGRLVISASSREFGPEYQAFTSLFVLGRDGRPIPEYGDGRLLDVLPPWTTQQPNVWEYPSTPFPLEGGGYGLVVASNATPEWTAIGLDATGQPIESWGEGGRSLVYTKPGWSRPFAASFVRDGVLTLAGTRTIPFANITTPQPVMIKLDQLRPVTRESPSPMADSPIRPSPNPTSNRTWINLDEEATILIRDLLGREIRRYDAHAGRLALDVGDLAPGVYVVATSTGETTRLTVAR